MKTLSKWLLTLACVSALVVTSTAQAEMQLEPGTSVVFRHHDLLGSPIMVSDHKGRTIWYENTAPYGKNLGKQSSGGVGHLDNLVGEVVSENGYTGHTVDNTTGLVYMKARHYDPVIGRFYSNDPVWLRLWQPLSFSRYGYAAGNPYNYVDYTGEAEVTVHYRSGSKLGISYNHAYLELAGENTSGQPVKKLYRAGPTKAGPVFDWGVLEAESGEPAEKKEKTPDGKGQYYDGKGKKAQLKQSILDNDEPTDKYENLLDLLVGRINASAVQYSPLGPNSNTFVEHAVEQITGTEFNHLPNTRPVGSNSNMNLIDTSNYHPDGVGP